MGLPFDEYRVFLHNGHLLSRKLVIKDQPYRRVTGMVREIREVLQNGSGARPGLRGNVIRAYHYYNCIDTKQMDIG